MSKNQDLMHMQIFGKFSVVIKMLRRQHLFCHHPQNHAIPLIWQCKNLAHWTSGHAVLHLIFKIQNLSTFHPT